MLNDELEQIWHDSAKAERVEIDRVRLLADLNGQLKRFDRVIRRRDVREIVAAVIVIVLFGVGTFYYTDILSRIGMILGVLYGILVIVVLKVAKRQKPIEFELPVKEYLVKYRDYLDKQKSLLKNIVYWYLLPPFVACLLFFIGQELSMVHLTINLVFILGLYTGVYFLNRNGVKKSYDPLLKQLGDTINDFETAE